MSKNELQRMWDSEIDLPYKDKVEKLQNYFLSVHNDEVGKPDFIEKVEFNDNGNKVLYPSFVKYKHHFTKDLYIREMCCPKDTICFSVIHKKSNPLFLLSGKIIISLEDGLKELVGPTYVLTEPGVKRVILGLEDVVVVTVHPNPDGINNLEEIEEQLYACTWKDFENRECR